MEKLLENWTRELELFKDTIPDGRYCWLKSLGKEWNRDKALVIDGWLMAMKENGKDFDLRGLIDEMLEYDYMLNN